jgi:hypothetical protein
MVKTSRKSFNKALCESTFSSLVNHYHRHGSKTHSPANVKQMLSSLCTVSFEALPPSSIMVGPAEASPSLLYVPAPTKAPSHAIPVEVMVNVAVKEIAPVPVEALSKAEPIAVLPSRPFGPSASVCLRALAPAWPIPAKNPRSIPSVPSTALGNHALSALGNQALSAFVPNPQCDGVLPPVEPRPVPALSVYPPRSDVQGPSACNTSTLPISGGLPVDPSLGHRAVPSVTVRPGAAVPQTRASGRSSPSVHDAPSVGHGPSQSPSFEPSSVPSPSADPSSTPVSATSNVAIASLSPLPRRAPVDTKCLANSRLSPQAQEWNPAQGRYQKEELRMLIARSTQQLHSSKSWS